MNLRNIFPRYPANFWRIVAELSKRENWLLPVLGEGTKVAFHPIGLDADELRWFAKAFPDYESANTMCLFEAFSNLHRHGVKLFQPTLEQCESCEHIDLNIPVDAYRQPFPTMVVKLPQSYCAMLEARHGAPAMQHIVVRHMEHADFVYVASPSDGRSDSGMSYTVGLRSEYPTMESAISWRNVDGADARLFDDQLRVSLNLALLLTQFPVRTAPSNPNALDRARRRRDRLEIAEHVHYVSFEQSLVVRKHEPSQDRGGTHASPRPHWRRGHWRQLEKCLTFVRPCMVNRRLFAGDESNTSYKAEVAK